jgi:PAS domain S-box-containing protein
MSKEYRYKQFFETVRDGILFLYADTGEIADVNPFFTELSGYIQAEIIGKRICEAGLFKNLPEFGKFIEKLKAEKYYRCNNMALCTADGREVPVEFTATEYMEDNKKMIRSIIHDISELINIEEKSIYSELRYRNIFEHSCIAIVVSGPDSRIIDANPTAVKMFGLRSREDILGKSAVIIYADPRQRAAIFKELNAKGYTENIETELVKQDGSGQHIITLSSAVIHRNEQGDILWTIGMMINITQRKKTEEALHQSIENFRALAENASDGILITIGEEGKYIYANKRAGEITGYTVDELLKMGIRDLLQADEAPIVLERHRKRIAGLNIIKTHEITLINKEGTKVQIEVSPARTIWQKEPVNMIIFRDITERKRIENELKHSRDTLRNLSMHIEKAREKERAEISMNLHDDLGQKLTALNIDLGWLKEKLSGSKQEVLDKLNEMSEFLMDSIGRIHSISKELRPSILDDLGLVEAVKWQLEEFKKLTGIPFELTITPEEFILSHEISTTAFRIVQEILTNVTRHANATSVRIELAANEKAFRITAIDNGRGIKREEINDSKSVGIIGMKERVRSSGGSFYIKGTEGKGTKIIIEIPYNIIQGNR